MMTWEVGYLDLLREILADGTWQNNRTGIRTKRIEGAHLKIDMRQGFPAVTTKKLAFKQVRGEMLGFIHGFDNAADFRDYGCTVWDQNANENKQWLSNPHRAGTDDLGEIYGVQWRNWWSAEEEEYYDQLDNAISKIMHYPEDRRIIVSAWNPPALKKMALPPCHVMHQYICNPETKELSMCMYQRSCDMFLGVPFNVSGYALLLELVARATGYKAHKLNMFLADVHIYENHMEQVQEQLLRSVYDTPRLWVRERGDEGQGIVYLDSISPGDILLEQYYHHPNISAPMAV